MSSDLHSRLVVIDGLIVARWSRALFQAMRDGGLTAANCTCSIWEDLPTTMKAVADWKRWLRENDDLIVPVRTTEDIRAAKTAGKVGIILGWQNSTGFGDYLPMVELWWELGLRIVQLTYNTANSVGDGCYERRDGGLTDFGREVVDEMNRLGIMVDLSHVGGQTARDAIRHSRQPVAFTHCLPLGLKQHPRNKSDDDLRLIADHGGFVGVTAFPPFLARGNEATVGDIIEALEYVIDLVGEECVGIGTDFTQDHGADFFDYITHDKGHARRLTTFGDIVMPDGFRRIEDFPNLTAGLERRGWPEARIARIMGENWMAHLRRVWGA